MKDKISKALKEVWEWKESIYNEVKDMELSGGLSFILDNAHKIANKNCIEKPIAEKLT